MKGWCPFETKPADSSQNYLIGVDSWTLFARINGRFPKYNEKFANTDTNPSMAAPNGITLFNISGIIAETECDSETGRKCTLADYQSKGGVILASFVYNCNLDHNVSECEPKVSFSRLDNPNDPVSSGFNFRFKDTYRSTPDQLSRDLWKLYGIYIVFAVYGTGGHFDIATLSVTLGSGAAFLSFAAVVCDLVMQYILPNRQRLLNEKIRAVDASVAYNEEPHKEVFDMMHKV